MADTLTRLSVNMNRQTTDDLKSLAEARQLSYTETIRRIVAVARYLEDELEQGRVIQVVDKDRNEVRELVIR